MPTTLEYAQRQYDARNEDFTRYFKILADTTDALEDCDEDDIAALSVSFWADGELNAYVNGIFEEITIERALNPLIDASSYFVLDELSDKIRDAFESKWEERTHLRVPEDEPSYIDIWVNNTEEFFRCYLKVNTLPYKIEYWLRQMGDNQLPTSEFHVLTVTPTWVRTYFEILHEYDFVDSRIANS
jgi:hypothetical protein